MPVRIYSLAKELKLDSKVLVDICTSAGVTGKGSALASLTDEEVERVKAYHRPAAKPAPSRAAGPPPRHRARPSSRRPITDAPSAARTTSRRPARPRDKVPVLRRSPQETVRRRRLVQASAAPCPGRRRSSWRRCPTCRSRRAEPEPAEVAAKSPTCGCRSTPSRRQPPGGTKPLIDHVRKTAGQASRGRRTDRRTPPAGRGPLAASVAVAIAK